MLSPSMNPNSLSDLFAGVYHFSVGITGLAYLGLGLGFLAATLFGARISDQIYYQVRTRFLLRTLTHLPLSWQRETGDKESLRCACQRSYLAPSLLLSDYCKWVRRMVHPRVDWSLAGTAGQLKPNFTGSCLSSGLRSMVSG